MTLWHVSFSKYKWLITQFHMLCIKGEWSPEILCTQPLNVSCSSNALAQFIKDVSKNNLKKPMQCLNVCQTWPWPHFMHQWSRFKFFDLVRFSITINRRAIICCVWHVCKWYVSACKYHRTSTSYSWLID